LLSNGDLQNIKIYLDELIEKQIINSSASEFSSLIFLVKKKNMDRRLYVDDPILNEKHQKQSIYVFKNRRYYILTTREDNFHQN
jgi:hypothetical protein